MNRVDPFFQTTKPHTRPFIESLHRTYGEPKGALPKRDEAAFARALAFRRQEKQRYTGLESENARLHNELQQVRVQQELMKEEADKIKMLWEQLSKRSPNGNGSKPLHSSADSLVGEQPPMGDARSVVVGGRSGSVHTGANKPSGQSTGVAERAKVSGDRGGGSRRARVPEATGREDQRGGDDEVPGEVLPADLPGARGRAEEHAAEGPEQRGRAGERISQGRDQSPVRVDEA